MHEPDLRRHLAAQTRLRIGLVDLAAFALGRTAAALAECLSQGDAAVLFDGMGETELEETGRLLWQCAVPKQRMGPQQRGMDAERPLFCAGSSGLTYALLSEWRRAHLIGGEPTRTHAAPVDTLLVMSGSCSPVTERQIRAALANGYHGISLDVSRLLDESPSTAAAEKVVDEAVTHLRAGQSTVIYSALGPLAPAAQPGGGVLGSHVGALLRRILTATHVRRIVLAGGDTSTHAVAQLGIHALTWVASLEPGAPLCCAHGEAPELGKLQLVLKGGQVGRDDFFERVRLWH